MCLCNYHLNPAHVLPQRPALEQVRVDSKRENEDAAEEIVGRERGEDEAGLDRDAVHLVVVCVQYGQEDLQNTKNDIFC
jgi:hypothetical protein